jgi:hypothetical protein
MLLTYRPLEEGQPMAPLPGVAGRSGLFARSLRGRRVHLPDRTRGPIAFVLSFVLITVVTMLWPTIDPGLRTFYERTIAFQSGRSSPFSIWGQVPALEPLRIALLAATGALSIALAFVPRRKSLVQVAALGAALLIALQLTMHHWFYLYIVWFFPLLLVALAAIGPATTEREAVPAPSPARRTRPVPTS